jgi:flagellar biosynthesis protein FlhG
VIIKDAQTFNQIRGSSKAGSVIIAVGGGKGGVGKSFISSNLGIFLANMGFTTTMIDLDLGAPNLHTCLGEEHPKKTFHDFLNGKIDNIEAAAQTTRFPKLRLISGANDHSELANISMDHQSQLLSAVYRIESDFTILDLAAGTHTSTLDFFLMAQRHLVVLTPDPTSIENAYRFMKAAYFRKIKRYELQLGLREYIAEIMSNTDKYKIRYPSDLIGKIVEVDAVRGSQLSHNMSSLDFNLILSQTRSRKDITLGDSIRSVCNRYFGVPTNFLGYIEYDDAVWHSLRKRRPLLLEFPHSPLYAQILSIARDLASPHIKRAVV